MTKQFFVYIITNKINTTLYIGITSNLIQRIWQHKNKIVEGFSSKYNLDKLVYYEIYENPEHAIQREKNLKFWKREWKMKLVEGKNLKWKDLYDDLM
jgi:putative endonuclease